jgi:hypothetical protein
MHIRLLLIVGGCGHFPTIHVRLGYNYNSVIDDVVKDTDTTNNLSDRWPPRHPAVLLNVTG